MIDRDFNVVGVTVWAVILHSCDRTFLQRKRGNYRALSATKGNTLIQTSNEILLYSVGTEKIVYYQSIKLATCFGSSSHHQANSQNILKVHSVDVHIY